MCLAVPGRVVECREDQAVVDLQGSRLSISKVLTPEVRTGDWVLVHAGFSITQLDEAEARQTWDYLRQIVGEPEEPAVYGGPTPRPEAAGTRGGPLQENRG